MDVDRLSPGRCSFRRRHRRPVRCRDAVLEGADPDGDALSLNGAKIGGSVILDGLHTTAGAIQLPHASIGGSLYCQGTRLAAKFDALAEPEMRWVMDFILGVRQIRGEMDIAPSRKLEVLLQNAGSQDAEALAL
jgi:hypothetical protein